MVVGWVAATLFMIFLGKFYVFFPIFYIIKLSKVQGYWWVANNRKCPKQGWLKSKSPKSNVAATTARNGRTNAWILRRTESRCTKTSLALSSPRPSLSWSSSNAPSASISYCLNSPSKNAGNWHTPCRHMRPKLENMCSSRERQQACFSSFLRVRFRSKLTGFPLGLFEKETFSESWQSSTLRLVLPR